MFVRKKYFRNLVACLAWLPCRVFATPQEDPMAVLHDLLFSPQAKARMRQNLESMGHEFNADVLRKLHTPRHLQETTPTRDCGQVISILTVDDISVLTEFFIALASPPNPDGSDGVIATFARPALTGLLNYGIRVTKTCTSCAEIAQLYANNNNVLTGDYADYCSPTSYAYDATLSTLQFTPLLNNETLPGTLRGFMKFHATELEVMRAPTELWPDNMVEYIATVGPTDPNQVYLTFNDFLGGVVSASAGMLAMYPDYTGYGESYNFNRTYIQKEPYQKAAALSWLSTQTAISTETGDCTALDDVVTLSGHSEGGYAVIAGGRALHNLRVRIVTAYVMSAPIDLETQIIYIVDVYRSGTFNASTNQVLIPLLSAFLGFAYSNGYEFLANSNSSQTFLDDQYVEPVANLFKAGVETDIGQIFAILPAPPLTLLDGINPSLISAAENAILENNVGGGFARPCDANFILDGANDLLCQALRSNSLLNDVNSSPFPIVVCHSPDDTVVPPTQLDNLLFDGNPNLSLYQAGAEFLEPAGDHTPGQLICELGPLVDLSLSGGDDAPNAVAERNCGTEPPSFATGRGGGIRTTTVLSLLLLAVTALVWM